MPASESSSARAGSPVPSNGSSSGGWRRVPEYVDSACDLSRGSLLKSQAESLGESLSSFWGYPAAGSYGRLIRGVVYDDAPAFMQTNPSLRTGYRVGGTHGECLHSGFFELHNETLNVWTLVMSGLFAVAALAYVILVERPAWQHLCVFAAFAAHSLLHHPCAILYHCFTPINAEVYNFWRKMDVCMIFAMTPMIALTLATYVLTPPTAIAVTVTAAAAASAGIASTAALKPGQTFNKARQAACLAASSSCYIIPLVVGWCRGIGAPWAPPLAITGLFAGGAVYACEWPECVWSTPAVDVWLNSHALMHVFVIVTHVAEFAFLLTAYRDAMEGGIVAVS